MEETQPDNEPSLQDLLQWKDSQEARRKGFGGPDNNTGPTYIARVTLEKELTEERVEKILAILFKEGPVPNARFIRENYLRPFMILLTIGCGRMIKSFEQEEGLRDKHLPFRSKPDVFPTVTGRDLFAQFDEQQWQYCPTQLVYDMKWRLKYKEILTIKYKKQIGDGGSAFTFKIEVDEDYNRLVPASSHAGAGEHAPTQYFVLKTYRTPDAQAIYENERTAFETLRFGGVPPPEIIGFYGSFEKAGSFNIILEYADLGTLDDYMEKLDPPSSTHDIVTFYDSFSAVIAGIVRIHNTKEHVNGLLGWHQDLNPTNILVRSKPGPSRYDCEFKVADLNLTHFKKQASSNDATDEDRFGENAYGAPETFRNNALQRLPLQVGQSIDIWSVGCIMSEVAVWVTQGWKKVLEYRRRRKRELVANNGPNVEMFHYDYKILDTVAQIHKYTVESSRRSDFVTPHVIQELVRGTIRIESNTRGHAQFILGSLKHIIENARKQTGENQGHSPDLQAPTAPRVTHNRKIPPNMPPGRHHKPSNESVDSRLSSADGNFSSPAFAGGGTKDLDHQLAQDSHDFNPAWHDNGIAPLPPPNRTLTFRHSTQPESSQQYDLRANITRDIGESRADNRFSVNDGHDPLHGYGQPNRPQRRETRNIPLQGTTKDTLKVEPPIRSASPYQWQNLPPLEPPLPESIQSPRESEPYRRDHGIFNGPPACQSGCHPHPEMSLDKGLEVKRLRDRGRYRRYPHEDEINGWTEVLQKRDHVFLIDNAESMGRYRTELRNVLELLSSLVAKYDPDGLDLYFSTQARKLKPGTNAQMIRELDIRPARGYPDFRERFASILGSYQEQLGKTSLRTMGKKLLHPNSTPWKGPRPLSLYVLTDGIWQGRGDLIEEVRMLTELLDENKVRNKHVGIQFIRFGEDPVGIKRMKMLDSGLKKRKIVKRDIVDTTSAKGNVWKWLLGAVNDWFDDDSDEDDNEGNS